MLNTLRFRQRGGTGGAPPLRKLREWPELAGGDDRRCGAAVSYRTPAAVAGPGCRRASPTDYDWPLANFYARESAWPGVSTA